MLKLFSDKPKILVQPDEFTDECIYGVPKKHPMSTIEYAITCHGAAAMVENSICFDLPVDMALKHWWNHRACVMLVQPNLCVRDRHHIEFSNIGKDRDIEKENGKLKRFLRNVRFQIRFNLSSILHRYLQPKKPCW
jgi:hypothetical protein